jgi:hypothetical protein
LSEALTGLLVFFLLVTAHAGFIVTVRSLTLDRLKQAQGDKNNEQEKSRPVIAKPADSIKNMQ